MAVLSLQKQNKIVIKNKIYAYDINSDLINVYKNIQSNKEELYNLINLYIKEYDSIKGSIINRKPTSIEEAKTSKESYYYWIRNKYNNIDKNTIECSALFMFINNVYIYFFIILFNIISIFGGSISGTHLYFLKSFIPLLLK